MQPIITDSIKDSNSAGSNNTKGFTKNEKSASLARHNDDYLDVVLRKEINLWFQQNDTPERQPGIIEPTKGYPIKSASSV